MAQLHHRAPPGVLDIAQQQHAHRPVVVGGAGSRRRSRPRGTRNRAACTGSRPCRTGLTRQVGARTWRSSVRTAGEVPEPDSPRGGARRCVGGARTNARDRLSVSAGRQPVSGGLAGRSDGRHGPSQRRLDHRRAAVLPGRLVLRADAPQPVPLYEEVPSASTTTRPATSSCAATMWPLQPGGRPGVLHRRHRRDRGLAGDAGVLPVDPGAAAGPQGLHAGQGHHGRADGGRAGAGPGHRQSPGALADVDRRRRALGHTPRRADRRLHLRDTAGWATWRPRRS